MEGTHIQIYEFAFVVFHFGEELLSTMEKGALKGHKLCLQVGRKVKARSRVRGSSRLVYVGHGTDGLAALLSLFHRFVGEIPGSE